MSAPAIQVQTLRLLAACLMSASGVAHVAALWFRELDGAALNDALLGAFYLILGLGLFGLSRFSLALAVIVPTSATVTLLLALDAVALGPWNALNIGVNTLVSLLAANVFWHLRHQGSV